MITWFQYCKLKPLQPLFSKCNNNQFIAYAFLSNNHNQSCSKSPHQYGATLKKRQFCGQKKLSLISLARTVTICDMYKSIRMFLHIPVSKCQFFSFENYCLGKKTRAKIVGTFKKFWGWGTETFSVQSKTQTSCDMDRHYLVSFHGNGMTVQCHLAVQCHPI